MTACKVSVKALVLASTDFDFLFRDGVLQRRFNEVTSIAVAKRMITAYLAVVLYDASLPQGDFFEPATNWLKVGQTISRLLILFNFYR